jgi:hypothetical protein
VLYCYESTWGQEDNLHRLGEDMECARCHKTLKEWMSGCGSDGVDSLYGEAKVCDCCQIQEFMEINGRGPTKEPYWKVESDV